MHRDGWNTSRTKLETFEVETVKHRGGLIATAEETTAGICARQLSACGVR